METFFLITNIVLLAYITPMIFMILINYTKHNSIFIEKKYYNETIDFLNAAIFIPIMNIGGIIESIKYHYYNKN